MTNVGAGCAICVGRTYAAHIADAVKERTPKREIFTRKFLVWAQEEYFCDCHGAIPWCAIRYFGIFFGYEPIDITVFDSTVIFFLYRKK